MFVMECEPALCFLIQRVIPEPGHDSTKAYMSGTAMNLDPNYYITSDRLHHGCRGLCSFWGAPSDAGGQKPGTLLNFDDGGSF
jgi:hypothetical protein